MDDIPFVEVCTPGKTNAFLAPIDVALDIVLDLGTCWNADILTVVARKMVPFFSVVSPVPGVLNLCRGVAHCRWVHLRMLSREEGAQGDEVVVTCLLPHRRVSVLDNTDQFLE